MLEVCQQLQCQFCSRPHGDAVQGITDTDFDIYVRPSESLVLTMVAHSS